MGGFRLSLVPIAMLLLGMSLMGCDVGKAPVDSTSTADAVVDVTDSTSTSDAVVDATDSTSTFDLGIDVQDVGWDLDSGEIQLDIGTGSDALDATEVTACGDGECGEGEDPCTCQEDCLTGNACCSDDDCPLLDCGPCCYVPCVANECVGTAWLPNCCWNGECEEGEDWESCPADCPEPTECVKEGGSCVLWTPGGSCEEGLDEVAFMCESKSEACCMAKPAPQCEELFGCESDDDCVKTDGDCCGCAAGGFSVAVAVACLEQWHNAMECSPDIGCLGVYFCDDSVAACVDGVCDLVTPPDPVE